MVDSSFDRTPQECRTLVESRLGGKRLWVLRRLHDGRRVFSKLGVLPEECVRVVLAYQGRCVYCAATLPSDAGVDFLVPEARGGILAWDNLVASCERCSTERAGRHLDRFLARRLDLDVRAVYARIAEATARLREALTRSEV